MVLIIALCIVWASIYEVGFPAELKDIILYKLSIVLMLIVIEFALLLELNIFNLKNKVLINI